MGGGNVKTITDLLNVDRVCAPLKGIPMAVRETIDELQRAETVEQQLSLLRELHRYIEERLAEAQREI